MLLRVGIDITKSERPSSFGLTVTVSRFTKIYERRGARFLRRMLHPSEREALAGRQPETVSRFLAGRWAVKEAAFKALSTEGVMFVDIITSSEGKGEAMLSQLADSPQAPTLRFEGSALDAAQKLGIKQQQLSLSHDDDTAVAVVILTG